MIVKQLKPSMNVQKGAFQDRYGVDKEPHKSTCTSWRGLVFIEGCRGKGGLESLPKIHPSQRNSLDFLGRLAM